MKRIASCWAALLLCAASPFALAANTWTVTSTGSGGACTANSTTDPSCTLGAAIADAADGDTVLFAPAIQGSTICCSFGLTAGLTIDGGSKGMILDGGGFGGVFYINSGNVVLSHLTIQHGIGNNSGGGIVNYGANLVIDSCTIANNTATVAGAGMYLSGGTTTIINSTFADNTSVVGGGIYALGALVIANSTFTGNTASGGYGGGLYAGGSFTLFSSVIAGNTGFGAPDIDSSATTTLGYNIVGNTTSSGLTATTGDQFGVDPLFVAASLANNGGPTQTVALQSQSPARSGGNCAGNASGPAISAVTVDQRGYTRTSPGAIGCTVGAFDMTSIFHDGFGN